MITALREGLSGLSDAGLANLLARGEIGGVPAAVTGVTVKRQRPGTALDGLEGEPDIRDTEMGFAWLI